MTGLRFSPPGSEQVSAWAVSRRFGFEPHPDEAWFRGWEPYDTIAPPVAYYNACAYAERSLRLVLVEPWYAADDVEPLDRAVFVYAVHPRLRRRAAMRVGEHAMTRTLYLEAPPPPTVKIGDKLWDDNVVTMAASPSEADAAFPVALRRKLAKSGLRGHLEMRAGGFVLHDATAQPDRAGYERAYKTAMDIVNVALSS